MKSTSSKALYKKRVLLSSFLLILLSFALIVTLLVVQRSQENRSKAFSGYSSKDVSVTDTLHYANASDIPQNPRLALENSSRGRFYALAQEYKNKYPQFQEIKNPNLLFSGKVFMIYDGRKEQTFLFARFENLPVIPARQLTVWSETKDIPAAFFPIGRGSYVKEDQDFVTYVVGVSKGDLSRIGKYLHFSYDTSESVKKPESIILSITL